MVQLVFWTMVMKVGGECRPPNHEPLRSGAAPSPSSSRKMVMKVLPEAQEHTSEPPHSLSGLLSFLESPTVLDVVPELTLA